MEPGDSRGVVEGFIEETEPPPSSPMNDNEGGNEVPKQSTQEPSSTGSNKTIRCPQKKRKAMQLRSQAWKHFDRIETESGEQKAKCRYCSRLLAANDSGNGTSSLNHHSKICGARKELDSKQTELVFNAGNQGEGGLGLWKFDQELVRNGLAEMIILDELPFRFVEKEGFRKILTLACPKFCMPSRHTIARDCFQKYEDVRIELKSMFRKTQQRVCITTDSWTSLQKVNYMSVTAHFIDENWKLQKKILNFCPISSHKGAAIAKAVENCLLQWGIERVFTVTVDNAASNDVAIDLLKKRINNWGTGVADCRFLHMRCIAHIINLVVVDGLNEKAMQGSVSRVRAAVKFVRNSAARLTHFKRCIVKERIESKSLLCLDVSTRWNSTYLMLAAAEKFDVAFDTFSAEDPFFAQELEELGGIPSSEDWKNVRRLIMFLEHFYYQTCKVFGSLYVTSNNFFHEIDEMSSRLQEWILSDDEEFSKMAKKMKQKYDKYWGDVEKMNMLIYIAVVLDPRHKFRYIEFAFEEMFESDKDLGMKLTHACKEALNELFRWYEKTYQRKVVAGISSSSSSESSNDLKRKVGLHAMERKKKFKSMIGSHETKSDLVRYLNEDCEPEVEDQETEFDILNWWKVNAGRFPILSLMARDVLAIPISTVASESVFSTGGRVLDAFRSSLAPRMAQALICCQDWLRRLNIEDSVEEDLMDFQKMDEDFSKLALDKNNVDE